MRQDSQVVQWAIAACVLTGASGLARAGIIVSDYPPEPTVVHFADGEPPACRRSLMVAMGIICTT